MRLPREIIGLIKIVALIVVAVSTTKISYANGLPIDKSNVVSTKIGKCEFRFHPMYGVRYIGPQHGYYPQTGQFYFDFEGKSQLSQIAVAIPLTCQDANTPGSIDAQMGAVFENGQWKVQDGDENRTVPFDKAADVQTIDLHGPNSSGKALLYNDTSGDEGRRVRHINFCLIHNAVALCGSTYVRALQRPKVDSTAELKKLIESIEFIGP